MLQELSGWRKQFAPDLVGESPRFAEALQNLQRVASSDATIVLCGETGTGKDLFARAVHRASPRRNRPFIPVNCAAFQDSLLETELFGHVKGAFTGATQVRAGRFLAANGGTLFLDEVGELSPAAQAKLLRVLEDRVVTPVGSDTGIPIDVRVVAATHRRLEDMVQVGAFRADLYYRLTVVPIEIPSLRERGDDIDRITDVCVARVCERLGKSVEGIDKEARAMIRAYSWPGNVRELCHCIERTVLLAANGAITATDLKLPVGALRQAQHQHHAFGGGMGQEVSGASSARAILSEALDLRASFNRRSGASGGSAIAGVLSTAGESESLDLRSAVESLEKHLINQALDAAGGNRTEAAALLGLNRTTLVEKLRKYGV
jgi:sigma-54 dependent transcriptional regulator, flagellar regulatory protein